MLGSAIQWIASPDGFLQTWLVDGLFLAGGTIFMEMIQGPIPEKKEPEKYKGSGALRSIWI